MAFLAHFKNVVQGTLPHLKTKEGLGLPLKGASKQWLNEHIMEMLIALQGVISIEFQDM